MDGIETVGGDRAVIDGAHIVYRLEEDPPRVGDRYSVTYRTSDIGRI